MWYRKIFVTERPLKLLARKHDVVAARILDPRTVRLPNAGLIELRDLETGRPVLVDSGSRYVRAAYERRMEEREEAFAGLMRRAGVDRMDLTTDASVADPIVSFFRMRELRGAHR